MAYAIKFEIPILFYKIQDGKIPILKLPKISLKVQIVIFSTQKEPHCIRNVHKLELSFLLRAQLVSVTK